MPEGLDLWVIVLLCVIALAAGWIDAVSGGGGLLQLPALLLALPGYPPAAALATNKLSSIVGTSAAATTYVRRYPPDLRTAVPMAVAAFVGAGIGSAIATQLSADVFLPVVWVLLVVVWIWTLLRPGMGVDEKLRFAGRKRHYGIAVVAGLGIGTYDGLIGPGTGSFLLITLVAGLGMSFLHASGTSKIVNWGTNLASLIVFTVAGAVLWPLGLLMGAFNLVGGIIGARTAIARGSSFVRIVFLIVGGLLIVRLGLSVFGIW